jgi:hypothetical protein
MVSIGRAPAVATDAPVSSGPEWHPEQLALGLAKICRPRRSCPFSAVLSPAMNRSNGVWSEISVDSYCWMARPKNSAKLYCATVYSFAASGRAGLGTNSGPAAPTRTTMLLFHHFGWNACRIRSS